MRVVLVIHSMAAGGAERVAAQLANHWDKEGDEVHLITMSAITEDFYPLHTSVKRHSIGLPSDSINALEAIRGNFKRIKGLREALKRIRPDIAIGIMTGAAVTTLLASRGLSMKVIVSERTHPPCYPLGRMWEWLRRITYPWAYRVVMQTDEGLLWLKQTIPTSQGVVIPNAVIHPLPTSMPIVTVADYLPAGAKMLLAVGRLVEAKQIDHVVEAFSRVAEINTKWFLMILGIGPEHIKLKATIGQHMYADRMCMLGQVGNIGDWYERADLYVMSSRFEGFPNTLAEAMAYACAAVSYDCDTGPRDIIRHGIDGLLVQPPGDVTALAQALNTLMGDEVRLNTMGSKATEVKERFSPERIFSLWESIIKEKN